MKNDSPGYSSLDEIIALLNSLLGIRVSFFDIGHAEQDALHIPPKSEYCAVRRKAEAFNEKCRLCDTAHLEKARAKRDIHVYHCHAGLLEAIVPLYDKHGEYLGALFFGQMRDAALSDNQEKGKFKKLFESTPKISTEKMQEIGELLRLISEYIVGNELVAYRRERWADILKNRIEKRLANPPTLQEMSQMVHHSESFLSHNFARYLGASPRKYIQQKRMEKAKELLEEGRKVFEVAGELGFYDEFHFSKAFKKHFGVSPSGFKSK